MTAQRGAFRPPRSPLFWLAAVAVLLACGCGRKSLSKSATRRITREIVSAAQEATARKSQVTIRHGVLASSGPGSRSSVDEIFVTLSDPSQESVLHRSMVRIARRHGLALTESSSDGVVSLNLAFHGERTHSVHLAQRALVSAAPKLAIIVDDLGYDRSAANALLALPFPLTISVLPHLPLSAQIAEQAYRRGDQVLLHFPMQPESAAAQHERIELAVGMNATQVASALAGMLQTVPHAVGVNNHEGSRATADPALMQALMPLLRRDGLFFIDSRTTTATVAYDTARESGVAAASRNVFLDDVPSANAILAQLDLAARDAATHGSAIAIGHPRPETIAALAKGLPLLQARGVHFVFASDLVQRGQASERAALHDK